MEKKNKKVSTTFTINRQIMELLKDTSNKSKLVEWVLLKHFKENGFDVDKIIL